MIRTVVVVVARNRDMEVAGEEDMAMILMEVDGRRAGMIAKKVDTVVRRERDMIVHRYVSTLFDIFIPGNRSFSTFQAFRHLMIIF